MSDEKKVIETTKVTTETEQDRSGTLGSEYRKETTVKTERTVEEEPEEKPVIIIKH